MKQPSKMDIMVTLIEATVENAMKREATRSTMWLVKDLMKHDINHKVSIEFDQNRSIYLVKTDQIKEGTLNSCRMKISKRFFKLLIKQYLEQDKTLKGKADIRGYLYDLIEKLFSIAVQSLSAAMGSTDLSEDEVQ